eukprot:CAMPEP_0202890418 /NCGR_PEP_ID=MMETSP1392-20130828/826_1 /ASSEMBLY_ACC=CAM_ASM_000868 /TAXON_ID=225041 /ORGANISM="Chlamydomonas chlamydogama, Strain SAG 11-48b" /LENGTH=419 /DNA_ID=CAMNT_0049573979 /DNA_START=39 /DNA_END=1298 /DNA_ORIENTATION=+
MLCKIVAWILYLLCLLSQAEAHPKIYVYDLKNEKYRNFTEFKDITDSFYGLDQLFPELLLNSSYVTTNAEEADYFYVHAWMYWPWQDIEAIVRDMQKIGPYWDRKRGRDHIFVVTADPGRCQFPQVVGRRSIYIHHFGRLQYLENERCNLFKQWGGECDWEMTAALAAHSKGEMRWGCHLPGQDIVVPPSPYEWHDRTPHGNNFRTPYLHPELHLNRTAMLYYSGLIDIHAKEPTAKDEPWSDASYSFGARQTVFRAFHSQPGFKIMTKHSGGGYWHDLSTSIFCLAPAGWAWGGRYKVAVTRGCIPVILQDGMKVEWEEQLPMKDYAIRVPTWLSHKLPDILQAYVDTGRVARMQKVLDCAWRLHWWRRPHGRAFELTMCELKRRVLGAAKIHVDWDACTLDCGDGKQVPIRDKYDNI